MADRPIHLDPVDPVQAEIFRSMTGQQRLQAAVGLHRAVRRMLRAHVADQHPDWDDEQLEREVTRRLVGGNR